MNLTKFKLALLRAALIAAKFIVVTLLLCVSAMAPIAGWHRLALRIRGWWIWPLVAVSSVAIFDLAFFLGARLQGWYLLAAAPYAVLMIVDSWLVLPWCIEHTKRQMDGAAGKEIAA